MIKEQRINYAIGIIFSILLLSFMAAPYFGDTSCYGLLGVYNITHTLKEESRQLIATCIFAVISITLACILFSLAVAGFILRWTRYKQSKADVVISFAYSLLLFVIIATTVLMLIFSEVWFIKAQLQAKYGYIVIFVITFLFPMFCTTKLKYVLLTYLIVIGMIALSICLSIM
ncbi:MAG: hypothetical protein K2M47_03175 [Clostridiales bacterium]|nr:hypothetical protein [Clostridiales bacterium]